MVDEYGELGGLEHLDVDVRVPAGEHRQPAGRSEDVLWLASADVETADGRARQRTIFPSA